MPKVSKRGGFSDRNSIKPENQEMGAHFLGNDIGMELKKPTTYDQQLELLKNKGIVIENEESCKRFLSRVNYYHFPGYVLPYMNRKENKCREQIGFESLLQLNQVFYPAMKRTA